MTASELLQLIWASAGDPDDPHADPVGKTKLCLKAIDEYRTEECRKALLAAANYLNENGRGGASEGIVRRIANDSERLAKLMESSDG